MPRIGYKEIVVGGMALTFFCSLGVVAVKNKLLKAFNVEPFNQVLMVDGNTEMKAKPSGGIGFFVSKLESDEGSIDNKPTVSNVEVIRYDNGDIIFEGRHVLNYKDGEEIVNYIEFIHVADDGEGRPADVSVFIPVANGNSKNVSSVTYEFDALDESLNKITVSNVGGGKLKEADASSRTKYEITWKSIVKPLVKKVLKSIEKTGVDSIKTKEAVGEVLKVARANAVALLEKEQKNSPSTSKGSKKLKAPSGRQATPAATINSTDGNYSNIIDHFGKVAYQDSSR
ncbi:MAG: hypothetical protein GY804_12505 [Alphaproteobacteria bacterium]|nr:hypothetical protein [Alphaproteobacteria bacterium]